MTVALGASAYSVAVFHLMTHAFFKALLFLAAGSVIMGMHHNQDIRWMGNVRKYMPITWITSLLGTLALIGTPLFAGFYSKDEILWEAFASGNQNLLYAGLVGAFMTSLYTFRLIFVTFHGEAKTEAHAGHGVTYWLPLSVLIVLSTFIGAMNGYVLSMWRFRGSQLFFGLLLFGCFLPFQTVLLPASFTLGKMGLASTTTGLVFIHVVYGLAFTTLFFRNYYVSIPDALVKAARLDGAGFFTIFWKILLPMSIPIVMVCLIWQFTQIWNDFLFGVVFSSGDSQPITVALNNLVNTSTGAKEYNVDMAAAMIAGLPTLLVYIFAGKYFLRGLTSGAVKG